MTAVIGLTGAQYSKYYRSVRINHKYESMEHAFSWDETSCGMLVPSIICKASGSCSAFSGWVTSNDRTWFWMDNEGNLKAICTARDGASAQAVVTKAAIAT